MVLFHFIWMKYHQLYVVTTSVGGILNSFYLCRLEEDINNFMKKFGDKMQRVEHAAYNSESTYAWSWEKISPKPSMEMSNNINHCTNYTHEISNYRSKICWLTSGQNRNENERKTHTHKHIQSFTTMGLFHSFSLSLTAVLESVVSYIFIAVMLLVTARCCWCSKHLDFLQMIQKNGIFITFHHSYCLEFAVAYHDNG